MVIVVGKQEKTLPERIKSLLRGYTAEYVDSVVERVAEIEGALELLDSCMWIVREKLCGDTYPGSPIRKVMEKMYDALNELRIVVRGSYNPHLVIGFAFLDYETLSKKRKAIARELAAKLGEELVVEAVAWDLARIVTCLRDLMKGKKVQLSFADVSYMLALYYLAKYPHLTQLVEEKGIELDKENENKKRERSE